MGKVLSFLKIALSKDLCTVERFEQACKFAEINADCNKDGKISVMEALLVIWKYCKKR